MKLRIFIQTLSLLLGVAVFCMLGVWQLHRAMFKRELQSRYETRRQAPALTLSTLPTQVDNAFFPLRVMGHYDPAHTIRVGNKIYHHRLGYHMVIPFFPEGSQTAILVNQGWVAQERVGRVRADHRRRVEIIGLIYYPQKSFMLGKNILDFHWPLQIQQLDLPLLAIAMHTPLYPFVLLLSPEVAGEFVRDWTPVNTRPEIHLGYAVQWFAMGLGLGVYLLYSLIGKRE